MRILPRWLNGLIISALSLQLAACGTIMYPERKGQKDGRVDIGVALLDGIGLLFFIIPGVIAYAVDFSNGTIYLPGTSTKTKKAGLELRGLKAVKFDAKHYTPDSLRAVIRKETGYDLDWRDPRLQAVQLESRSELPSCFARTAPTAPAGSARRRAANAG
ncbi:MAG: polyribonucleotide nucleotidyltransferase [Elusimicrobia bacterium]|nr:polyribonucleotide nucleotidyltransferase [Elusimicrobiota bacterium]